MKTILAAIFGLTLLIAQGGLSWALTTNINTGDYVVNVNTGAGTSVDISDNTDNNALPQAEETIDVTTEVTAETTDDTSSVIVETSNNGETNVSTSTDNGNTTNVHVSNGSPSKGSSSGNVNVNTGAANVIINDSGISVKTNY